MDEHQKPVIVSSMLYGTLKDSKAFKKLNKNQIMVYSLPERAAKVLANLVEYGEYLNEF
jgi:acyl-CoA synthetase (NDP forming)